LTTSCPRRPRASSASAASSSAASRRTDLGAGNAPLPPADA
jgi:hypothetical protein